MKSYKSLIRLLGAQITGTKKPQLRGLDVNAFTRLI